jgi:hypothetical protein
LAPVRGDPRHRVPIAVDAVIGAVVLLALELPALLSGHAFFGDWGNHLYLVAQQAHWLDHHVLPTYFLHTVETGAFYPHYLFYGGTLYAITGRIATVVGVSAAFKLTLVGALAATYFGTLWLGRLLGVRGLSAHLPAVAAVSGAYYLSTQYDIGGWAEFVALSMIPLVVASATSLVLARTSPAGPGIALVASTVLLTGSHNITTAYGLIFVVLVALVAVFTLRSRAPQWRRLAVVGGTFVLAVGVNAWYLLPAAVYAHLTSIGSQDTFDRLNRATAAFNRLGVLFNPWRTNPGSGSAPLYVQQPVFVVVWLLLIAIVVVPHTPARARRVFGVLMVVAAAYLVLVLWGAPWDFAPRILRSIQFRLRLNAYLGLCFAGLAIIGLVVVQRRARRNIWIPALALACAAAFGAAIWQVWDAGTFEPIGALTTSGTRLPAIDYANCPAPCPTVERDYRMAGDVQATMTLPDSAVDIAEARSGTLRVTVPGGQLVAVNVAWSPVIGSDPVPMAGADADGRVVLDTRGVPAGRTIRTTVTFQPTTATTAGIAITTVSVVGLLALLGVGLARRQRRAAGSSKPDGRSLAAKPRRASNAPSESAGSLGSVAGSSGRPSRSTHEVQPP